ncbi:methylthioribulose 1-phosphate dehydratase [Stagnimonas aquatica]|uniref:Methylthioribulose-1-phosphate dehydratase n=1 Tax=Stagnimonas aquatica TaxID=2689987 RepID=A0A3N0VKK9_9GAMM|nr:methylthioribulose 1-phosphate dehydratase [Stagnimonas aquatica]ROH93240.1 methylthioribulose 1-phosphate dehydratase [Stagnimonas aquatica]
MNDSVRIAEQARQMIAAGNLFHARGWVPATGGNFSARLDSERVLITASGNHKGELAEADFLIADLDGKPLEAGRKASYETLLHMQIYRRHADAGAVLHTHSTANTVLSRRYAQIVLSNYELLKVLPGAPDPQSNVAIPVFANDQDIARLSAVVDAHMVQAPTTPAYLIAGHGLYAWGATVAQARHRVEAIEFMLECHLREAML